MVSFTSDYNTGAHPDVLKRLLETNLDPMPGYGEDRLCAEAKEKIRQAVGMPDADVELITGGTQTNAVVISTLLRDWEGAVAADTGHIAAHEAGAVEYTGHKVLTLKNAEGKIVADDLRRLLEKFYSDESHDHMVFPGLVYISHPTEYGTLYTKAELTALSNVCREYKIPLYLDGARLAYALMSRDTDVTLSDIARLCDVFYIGGTKVGALCGEAVVFTGVKKPAHFVTSVKKRGALLAKGRLLGAQFDALFTDGLYTKIGARVIETTERMKKVFENHGVERFIDSPTNQQFFILKNADVGRLREYAEFEIWEPYGDECSVVRFVAGWSTTDEDLAALDAALTEIGLTK